MNHSEHSEPITSEKENLNAEINFFSEEIDFQLAEQAAIRAWIERAVAEEKSSLTEVSYIFCLKFLNNPMAYNQLICGFTVYVLGTQISVGNVVPALLTKCM